MGLRFRSQHPIDIFIADFYCHPIKLVIEIDCGIHKSRDQKEYDIGRTAELNDWGIEVMRFTNDEIDKNIIHVIKEIEHGCIKRQSELPQSPLGDLGVVNSGLAIPIAMGRRAATRNPVEALRYE